MSTFVLAHLSDPHLGPLPSFNPFELLSKRGLGYLNWLRKRRAIHRPVVLAKSRTVMWDPACSTKRMPAEIRPPSFITRLATLLRPRMRLGMLLNSNTIPAANWRAL